MAEIFLFLDVENACNLPFREGLCGGKMTRYYYDVKDDSCKTFQFHGCKGNDNNFAYKAVCEKTCKGWVYTTRILFSFYRLALTFIILRNCADQ